MKINEQLASVRTLHLLQWMSCLLQSDISHLSVAQIMTQKHLVNTLILVDRNHFHYLESLQTPNFLDLLLLIEDYVERYLKKEFRKKLWSEIIKRKSFLQLLSLVTYVAVHSEHKSMFIPCIMGLSEHSQNSIKDVIEEAGNWVETPTDIKDILDKVSQLEGDNEVLRQFATQRETRIQRLEQQYKMLESDYYFVENELKNIRKQKTFVCKQLGLNAYDDFVQKYRILEKDLDNAYGSLNHNQEKIKQLQTDRRDCKAKIMDNCELIVELNEELKTARDICKSLRINECVPSPLQMPFLSVRIMKENIPLLNLPQRDNDDTCAHRQKLFNFLHNSEEELEDEVLRLRDQLQQLQDKNQYLQQQVVSLKRALGTYREERKSLKVVNRLRKWKLMELQSIYREFKQDVGSN